MITQWISLADELGLERQAAEAVWQALVAAYEADGRFYHNLTHIEQTLAVAEQLKAVAVDFTAVQLALWFHDVVYDPRRSDNEAESAEYAERVLRPLGVSDELLAKVRTLILATKTHEAVADPNVWVMLDADLAILSAPPEQYDAYARAIRQEYSFVPDEQYVVGRTAVLQTFLARSPFYFTEWMRGEGGDTAVYANLNRELAALKKRNAEGR